MRVETVLELSGVTIRVSEPTIEGLRSLLQKDDLIFDPMAFLSGRADLPAELVALFTDTPQETLKQLSLSEFKVLLEAVRDLLSPFLPILEMLGAVRGYLREVQKEEKPSKDSSEASSP